MWDKFRDWLMTLSTEELRQLREALHVDIDIAVDEELARRGEFR